MIGILLEAVAMPLLHAYWGRTGTRRIGSLAGLLAMLMLLSGIMKAQSTPVFRLGVLDAEDGPISRAARLAVEEINLAGGVRGADGTVFRLDLVIQPTDNLVSAISNINQARVIAVLGPASNTDVLNALNALQGLGVPVLTPATDDTIIALDTSDLIFRTRAQEVLLGRGLAAFIAEDLRLNRVVTVQLDLPSTASVIGFSTAAAGLGIQPFQSLLRDQTTTTANLANRINQLNPQIAVVFGPPADAGELFLQLVNSGYAGRFVYNAAADPAFRSLVVPALGEGILSARTWSVTYGDEVSRVFVQDYAAGLGAVPGPIEASIYDAVYMLASAIQQPGDLRTNLTRINGFSAVQGTLSPASLAVGEMSNHVAIVENNGLGGERLLARFSGGQRVQDPGTSNLPPINPGATRATPTPAASATPEGVVATITRNVQNVRSGPGTNYDVIGQLRSGEQVQVVGANVNFTWVVINFRGTQGWLSRDILDLFGDTRTLPIVAAPPTPTPLPATATPTAQPFPDAIVIGAQPNRLTLGQPFAVTVTVRNQGLVDAGAFAVAATFQPGNVYVGVNLPGLAAGQQTNVTLSSATPLTGTSGPQNVVIIADLNNQLNEGPDGEANNDDFIFSYVADQSVQTLGGQATITMAPGSSWNLDASIDDIQWSGGALSGINGAQIYLLAGFATLDQVHYDAISTTTNASPINVALLNNALIGVRTDGTNQKRGVIRVDSAVSGGNLTITYRVYN